MYYMRDSSKKKKKEKKFLQSIHYKLLPFQLLQLSVRGSGKRKVQAGLSCARNRQQLRLKKQ